MRNRIINFNTLEAGSLLDYYESKGMSLGRCSLFKNKPKLKEELSNMVATLIAQDVKNIFKKYDGMAGTGIRTVGGQESTVALNEETRPEKKVTDNAGSNPVTITNKTKI